MAPSRHNPNPNPPGRRPRVAGLRKPGESQRPTPRPRPAPPEQTDESPEQQATDEHGAEQSAGPPGPQQHREAAHAEAASDAEPQPSDDESERVNTGSDDTDSEGTGSEGTGSEQAAEEPTPRPGPRRKQRSESSDKPAGEQELVGAAAPGTPPARLAAARAGKKRGRLSNMSNKGVYILAAGLLVLASLFTTGAVFAKMGYSDVAKATGNAALVDVEKTQQVKKAMKSAAERLFSFDYRNIGKTEQAAKELLANKDVQRKYSMLMGEVKRLAPKQKIVVSVTASEAAVVDLREDSAKVMVYVDQTSTRSESKQTSAGGAALWFETELRDGKWKVVDMDTYNSGDPMQPKKQGGKQNNGANSPSPKPSGN